MIQEKFEEKFRNPWPVKCGAYFTGPKSLPTAGRRNPQLEGATFLWMIPI